MLSELGYLLMNSTGSTISCKNVESFAPPLTSEKCGHMWAGFTCYVLCAFQTVKISV